MSDLSSTDSSRVVRAYDFEQHETLDRGRLRRLTPILEVASNRIAGALTSTLRTTMRVEVGEFDQQRWEDYANALPQPTFLASATIVPMGGRVAVHVPLALAMAVVEVRLGGEPSGAVPVRPLSDIEQRLVNEFAETALSEAVQSLGLVVPMSVGVITSTSSAVFSQASNSPEVFLLVGLKLEIAEAAPLDATLCIPLSVLLPLLDALDRLDSEGADVLDSGADEVLERLLEAPLDVTVSFPDIVLSPEELLSLSVGDVIPLHRPEGVPLHLATAGVRLCEVVPTAQGKRLACLVVDSNPTEDY